MSNGESMPQECLLNVIVTKAMALAEHLERERSPHARDAFHLLSLVEEELAREQRIDDVEGMIARRGAIRAARKAGELDRAQELFDRYLGEMEATGEQNGATLTEALSASPIERC